MKIVFMSNHACARCQKQAIPLVDKGHNVHMIANVLPTFGEVYSTFCLYNTNEQAYDAIKLHSDADLFHCHNEPSWFVTMVKEVFPDMPVVLDVHDSMFIRYDPQNLPENATLISVSERNNFQLADGLVYVSPEMGEVLSREFELDQPWISLPSYVPKSLYAIDAFKWKGGVVYEGRIDKKEDLNDSTQFFTYCDYRDMAKALKDLGVVFNIMAPNRDIDQLDKDYGGNAVIQLPKSYQYLTRSLGSYDWGLLGNLEPHPAWKYAMPNKLFDYLAAGIPIIAVNAEVAGKFVEDNGFGMNITDVNDIPRRWKEHRECRGRIARARLEWTMDAWIHTLEGLYKKVLK